MRTVAKDIKPFISKFKKDLIKAITEYYSKLGDFEKQDRALVKDIVEALISYNMHYDACTVKTNFIMQDGLCKL